MPLPDGRISWSDSRIKFFEKCPYQFKKITLDKIVPFVESDAMAEGTRQHKMLEDRVSKGTPIPLGYTYLEPMMVQILNAPGVRYTEIELAVDRNHIACGYKDWDRCEGRSKADILLVNGSAAWAGDYKSGTPTGDTLQLKITAAMLFQHLTMIDRITSSYLWLKTGKLDPSDTAVYSRSDLPAMWYDIDSHVERMQEAVRLDNFPKRPKRHCRWCQVNKLGLCDSATEKFRE